MANTGFKGWKVLLRQYNDDNTNVGDKMPNVAMISPEAIVPLSATVTYNDHSNPAPTGGSDGDIWYNLPLDVLYKKQSGAWTALLDRVPNAYYIAPVINLTDCPV